MQKDDWLWIVLIVGGVILFNYLQPTRITTTDAGQPVAGQGVNPFDAGSYTVEAVVDAAGLGL